MRAQACDSTRSQHGCTSLNAHTAGQEKDYIRGESIRLFRQNKELLDPEVIRAKVTERASHRASLALATAGSIHWMAQLQCALQERSMA